MEFKSKIMILFLCGVLLCPACLFAQQVGAQIGATDFQRMDANKDGFIKLEEMEAYQESRFRQLDKNNDNVIDQNELTGDKEKIMNKFDNDANGKIDKKEAFAKLNEDFNKMDSNKDGKVSKEEFEQYWPVTVNF